MAFQIAPSILAADFLHLEKDIQLVNTCGDVIHLDVMDGTFVPNISFGFSVIDHIAKIATAPMDVHLMVVHPEKWFEKLASNGVQMCSFHWEAAKRNCSKNIDAIHALGMKAGIAINPDIPVEKLFPYIGKADYFLIMSVFAGFGGQKFIEDTYERIRTLRAEMERQGHVIPIEVDGGVSASNAAALADAGAEILVAGSAVFKSDDPESVINAMRG